MFLTLWDFLGPVPIIHHQNIISENLFKRGVQRIEQKHVYKVYHIPILCGYPFRWSVESGLSFSLMYSWNALLSKTVSSRSQTLMWPNGMETCLLLNQHSFHPEMLSCYYVLLVSSYFTDYCSWFWWVSLPLSTFNNIGVPGLGSGLSHFLHLHFLPRCSHLVSWFEISLYSN